jgi:hypothetical protein
VQSWLITSFSLPVAMTAGRLVVRTAMASWRGQLGAVTAAVALGLMMTACGAVAGHRRRRASQPGSPS